MPKIVPNAMGLMQAASEGHLSEVRCLLSQEMDITQAEDHSQKRTALHYALILPILFDNSIRESKLAIAQLLIGRSPEILASQDVAGDTAMHLMAVYGWEDLLEMILKDNPDYAIHLFLANNQGELPIHAAIANQREAVVEQLLEYEPMDSIVDGSGNTLLHHAAMANNRDAIQCIMKRATVDVHAINSDGKTALDIAKMNHFGSLFPLLDGHLSSSSMMR